MANKSMGKQSFLPEHPPVITAWASVASKKESEGPLAHSFDLIDKDSYFGQKTWEQAENRMQQTAIDILLKKSGKKKTDIHTVISGDLLNQCVSVPVSVYVIPACRFWVYTALVLLWQNPY